MVNVPKLFGSLTFNERVMKDRLPAKTFRTFRKMVEEGLPLTRELADMMAYAMKGGKARQFYRPGGGRPGHHGLLWKRSDSERAGRIQLPVRWSARHF